MSSNTKNTDNRDPKGSSSAKTDPNAKTGGKTDQRQMEQGLSSGKGGDPKRDQRQFGGKDEGNSGQRS